ncbi:hypothetical protein CH298_28010 [Rhodococcoides fascians]|uniref:alpha/beta hydrolase n=1 Tax=Rhodococcoides fascians TaxID=1828 RepID=UPI000B9BCF10|nr:MULTISPECIES: alpha/beta hydrolase [Rhodococcus]OZD69009.1 hypothetical protein CH263_09025 [Rhodococcus sp. 06-1059B-a]OZE81330.1 hypothetical protein CH303_27765 [Rhodococcus fascians]OZF08517.1 hypothetical protein CH298_28010 [Rhodococcus fascians]OZF10932.1 hypothetical protein CH297_28190 [Rhodococcus fascians]OZF59115.1 hypothetical protein CH308_28030 [Rhodococcus fascians]
MNAYLDTQLDPRCRRLFLLAGLLLTIAVWLEFFLVRYNAVFGVVIIVLALATAAVALRWRRSGHALAVALLAGIVAVLQAFWITTEIYVFWSAAFVATLLLVVATWVSAWQLRESDRNAGSQRVRQKILRSIGFAGSVIACVLSVVFLVLTVNPAPAAIALQSASGSGNSFEPSAPTETKVVNGVGLTNDIQYGTEFPNSYLDVYIADNDPTVSRPTFLVVHGGGFIAGSKSDGDPNAAGADDAYFALGSQPLLDTGYNVVSIDYALAPQYRYPTPTVQLGQALQFLDEHGADYGLDMSQIVLSGGSAGGHIVAQYAAIQTNPEYAEQVGIAPTIDSDRMKAVIFDSAALDPTRAGKTQAPVLTADWAFDLALRSYIGTSKATQSESNILAHITKEFPPSFIADGNTGTFPDQAADLAQELTTLGVENELFIPPVSQAVLGHGFMSAPSASTDEYNDRKLSFLAKLVD